MYKIRVFKKNGNHKSTHLHIIKQFYAANRLNAMMLSKNLTFIKLNEHNERIMLSTYNLFKYFTTVFVVYTLKCIHVCVINSSISNKDE